MSARRKLVRRQIFVLTPEEKKMAVFVLCALVLGFATKCYRDTHPRPSAPAKIEKAKSIRTHRASPSPVQRSNSTE
jgi:hypothetical protein